MTREEALEWLNRELKVWEKDLSKHPIKEALSVAIEALEQEHYYKDLAESYEKTINKLTKAIAEQEPSYNSVNSLVESKLKNPKAKTFDILHFVADNAGLSTFEAIEKAYNMGVSEQEPILDKIRAEIKGMIPTYHNLDWSITDLVPISEVLKLIDKYKAESEDKDGKDKTIC